MNLSMLSLNLSMLLFPVHGIIVGLCAPAHFFSEKIAGALFCHLRRKQLYITRRSEHHHHTNNAHNKTLHRHNAHNVPAHIAKQPVTEYMHVCLLASTFWPLQCRIAICDEHHWLPLSMGGNVHCSRFILRSTFQKKKKIHPQIHNLFIDLICNHKPLCHHFHHLRIHVLFRLFLSVKTGFKINQ